MSVLEADSSKTSAALDEAEEQLAEAQQALSDATAKLEDTEEQLAAARQELEAAKTKAATVEEAVSATREAAADDHDRFPILLHQPCSTLLPAVSSLNAHNRADSHAASCHAVEPPYHAHHQQMMSLTQSCLGLRTAFC